eukprot:1194640-Prorocentrum_minimum.AAC.7
MSPEPLSPTKHLSAPRSSGLDRDVTELLGRCLLVPPVEHVSERLGSPGGRAYLHLGLVALLEDERLGEEHAGHAHAHDQEQKELEGALAGEHEVLRAPRDAVRVRAVDVPGLQEHVDHDVVEVRLDGGLARAHRPLHHDQQRQVPEHRRQEEHLDPTVPASTSAARTDQPAAPCAAVTTCSTGAVRTIVSA